jgi:hypothetical protein
MGLVAEARLFWLPGSQCRLFCDQRQTLPVPLRARKGQGLAAGRALAKSIGETMFVWCKFRGVFLASVLLQTSVAVAREFPVTHADRGTTRPSPDPGVACFSFLLAGWPGEAISSAAADTITADDLRRHAAALADDTFEGRATGTRGGRAAAGYLQTQFKALGLKPAGEKGGYFQTFDGSSRNILGMIEGSDPDLRKEIILVSAHYDHVGYGNARNSFGPTGHIHNGADDNASGAATLVEVAEAVSKLEPKPRRSILFALWDAEETGLNGSKHWLSKPTVKLADVRVMINMDMVGRLRNNKLTVYGARTARGLRKFVSLPNREEPLAIDFSWEIRNDSDHHPFYSRGIPILMLHTGLHGDYHRPSDDVEKLNLDGMQRVAKLLFGLITAMADQPELPCAANRPGRNKPSSALSRPCLGVWAWSGIAMTGRRLD